MRDNTFGRLLKAGIGCIATSEGKKAPVIEDELGEQIGVVGTTIQYYKTGNIPSDPRTIQILAEACVRRGYLNRDWLLEFLKAARYATPEKILDQLYPTGPALVRPARVYHNLQAPPYSQFIMREEPFSELMEALGQRAAVVMIASMGGMGKTSLAYEIAAQCLEGKGDVPLFDAVAWVSDKDRPGTTTLSVVLDTIARTLDYLKITGLNHEEKRQEIEQLLRRQRVLLVIDNFETITDGALLPWLLRLPEPSKALVTSREYSQQFRHGSWTIELRGMQENEALELIAEQLRVLKINKLANDLSEFKIIIKATGSNPKAIKMALGRLKFASQPLQKILEDIHAARGELFEDLFARNWMLLDEVGQQVLMALSLFSASASSEALARTSGVPTYSASNAIEMLVSLALLDEERIDLVSQPRYALHPLVRTFAQGKLQAQPQYKEAALERWVDYFYTFVQDSKGWDYHHEFERVAHEITNLQDVMLYCYDTGLYEKLIDMVLILRSFWAASGDYEIRDEFVKKALEAARLNKNVSAQIRLLCLTARALCYQGDVTSAEKAYQEAHNLFITLANPDPRLKAIVNYTQIGICQLRYAMTRDLAELQQLFDLAQQNVELAEQYNWPWKVIYDYEIAEYYYLIGEYDKAEVLLQQLVKSSSDYRRIRIRGWLSLARIARSNGQLSDAEQYLSRAKQRVQELRHRGYLAYVLREEAQIFFRQNNISAALNALDEAIDVLNRLGVHLELDEVHKERESIACHVSSRLDTVRS